MIVLKGCKADHVSRERIRAFLYATLIVLSYHNRVPTLPLVVTIKRRMKDLGNCCGSRIELRADLQPEEMLTTCVHEVIHACINFPEGREEKCTTTLCSKIKADVLRIADICSKELTGVRRTSHTQRFITLPRATTSTTQTRTPPSALSRDMGGNGADS